MIQLLTVFYKTTVFISNANMVRMEILIPLQITEIFQYSQQIILDE